MGWIRVCSEHHLESRPGIIQSNIEKENIGKNADKQAWQRDKHDVTAVQFVSLDKAPWPTW